MAFESTTLPSEGDGETAERLVPALVWLFPSSAARTLGLRGAPKVIGRDQDCAVRIDSANVSRRHAEVYRQSASVAIKDLGSRNGVFVDGQRVAHATLSPEQVLRIGDHLALFRNVDIEEVDAALRFEEVIPGMLGGAQLAAALRLLPRAAREGLPVIIQGETGTGKELVARNVHAWSGRQGPFYAVNCAAIPESMLEAELFGYRKGAFTNASQGHLGHVRAAHGGTLFLDEVLDLPLTAQAKLLRVLEQREVVPLGENAAETVDVRIVCASQGSLRGAVERGDFRADLFARLNGYLCALPSLRDRRADIVGLFTSFLRRFAGERPPCVDVKLVEQLCLYGWPQNVRELELQVRSLVTLHGDQATLRREHLPPELLPFGAETTPEVEGTGSDDTQSRAEHDLKRLIARLRLNGGNVARAAAEARISRQRAYRLMNGRTPEELLAPDKAAWSDESAEPRH